MPLLRTVKPIKTLKDKDSGKNSTESVHNQEESSSCMSILFENEIVDFTTTKKTKRNRVCGGLCSYSPSGYQDLDILASGLVRSTLLSLLAFVMQRLSGSLYQLTNFNHQPGGQRR